MKGGPDSLRTLILHVKSRRFSGYIRVVPGEGGLAEGHLFLVQGDLRLARFAESGRVLQGQDALAAITKAAEATSTTIEVHALNRVEPIVDRLSTPETPKVPSIDLGPIQRDLESWRAEGFDVKRLEEALTKGETNAIREIHANLYDAVAKARSLLRALAFLEARGLEVEVSRVRAIVLSLELARAEQLLKELQMKASLPSPLQGRQGLAPSVGSPETSSPPLVPSPPPPGALGITAGLPPDQTFNTFAVGTSNRFALVASMAVAKRPGGPYNPLVIVGGPGLGKTHLIQAIGNHFSSAYPGNTVLYISARDYCREVEAYSRGNRLEEMRRRFMSIQLLLFDDLQDLGNFPLAQREFLHLFDTLITTKIQVVLAADRMPRNLVGFDARIISRLSAGLVVDIKPLDEPSRQAILQTRAQREGLELPSDVVLFLVSLGGETARDLEGVLHRLHAQATLLGSPLTVPAIRDILAQPDGRPNPPAGATEASPPSDPSLRPGRAYVVEEPRAEAALRMFQGGAASGASLLLTRSNPDHLRERWPLAGTEVYWLTDKPPPGVATLGSSLEKIMHTLEEFLGSNPKGIILLDGLEYLVGSNSFEAVLRFLRTLVDVIASSQHSLLVALDPRALEVRQLSVLEKEMEVVRPGKNDSLPR